MRLPAASAVLAVLAGFSPAPAAGAPWADGPFACYAVPPLSPVIRVPGRLPPDAVLSDGLRIIAARGEFEPASFLIAPRRDVAKLEIRPTALRGPGGEIPSSAVDVKIVKTWYQGGTAWFSYFGDSARRELVPELLLNDETLVWVDENTQDNYLRVGGEYQSISYPPEQARKSFNYLTEPVADSPALRPARLEQGRNKQIWVTVRVPQDAAEGVYSGRIEFIADGVPAGAMHLAVRVLPFELPLPKTYYDPEKDYLVSMYATNLLGVAELYRLAPETAEKRQRAIYRNLLAHNVFNVRSERSIGNQDPAGDAAKLRRELDLLRSEGFSLKPLLSKGWSFPLNDQETPEQFRARIGLLARTLKEGAGHDDIYITSWDEAGPDRVRIMREATEYANTQGLKLWVTTAEGRHFDLAGYVIDLANHGGWPKRGLADHWHAIGAKIASYGGPHTGPENPDIFRRWEGLARYKAFYDGSYNYKYFSEINPAIFERSKANVWNDFTGGTFRQFNLVYPTSDGVIDTMAWEGFREGIDDVRYATKLKQDAAAAMASGNVRAAHAAKKALMWLELLEDKTADLAAARQEMIEQILKIREAMQHP